MLILFIYALNLVYIYWLLVILAWETEFFISRRRNMNLWRWLWEYLEQPFISAMKLRSDWLVKFKNVKFVNYWNLTSPHGTFRIVDKKSWNLGITTMLELEWTIWLNSLCGFAWFKDSCHWELTSSLVPMKHFFDGFNSACRRCYKESTWVITGIGEVKWPVEYWVGIQMAYNLSFSQYVIHRKNHRLIDQRISIKRFLVTIIVNNSQKYDIYKHPTLIWTSLVLTDTTVRQSPVKHCGYIQIYPT